MKKLLFLLALCCAAVACESTPDYMKADIEPSISDGWYRYAGMQGIRYVDGKVDQISNVPSWNGEHTEVYYKVEDMKITRYNYAKCDECGEQVAFTVSVSYDLKNKTIENEELLQFNEDAIIYIEPLQEAIERCNDDKDFWRSYIVYTRKSPSDEELQAFDNAVESENGSWDFFNSHSNCKQQ